MRPAEKLFFLEYKAKNPENPWGYAKAWQKKLQAKYKQEKVQPKSSVKLKSSLSS